MNQKIFSSVRDDLTKPKRLSRTISHWMHRQQAHDERYWRTTSAKKKKKRNNYIFLFLNWTDIWIYLSERRIIQFIMTVTTITNNIQPYITSKLEGFVKKIYKKRKKKMNTIKKKNKIKKDLHFDEIEQLTKLLLQQQ